MHALLTLQIGNSSCDDNLICLVAGCEMAAWCAAALRVRAS